MSGAAFIEVYEDDAGEYRWRSKARNGRILSDSAEGFTSHSYAEEVARRENPGVLDVRIKKKRPPQP